jgi:hypothetical protein
MFFSITGDKQYKIYVTSVVFEYAQSEFQTLHNETIPAFEDKLMDETNQRLALELCGSKWNLII